MSRLLIGSEIYHAKATAENMNMYADTIANAISAVSKVPVDEVFAMLQAAWSRYADFAADHEGFSMLQDELQGVIKYACWAILENEYPGKGPDEIVVVNRPSRWSE